MEETSIFLARVLGLIFVIVTGAVLVKYKKFVDFELQAAKSQLFIFTSGFIFVIVGVLLVVSHSVWTFDWRIVITLLGWALLAKGIGRILFPEAVMRMIEKKQTNRWFIAAEAVAFLIGLYFLYYGFVVY